MLKSGCMRDVTFTAPEALRHYADTRTDYARFIGHHFALAKRYWGSDKKYHAEKILAATPWRIRLLEFLVSHLDSLSIDAESENVLRNDLTELKTYDAAARAFLVNPWGPR